MGPRRLGRWRLWRRLSIQSQLLTMLLVVSVASVLVAGTIGYLKGRDSLRDAAFAELTAVREARARELTRFYEATLDALVIYTRGATASARPRVHRGFHRLANSTVTTDQSAALAAYYQDVFVPLDSPGAPRIHPAGFFPDGPASGPSRRTTPPRATRLRRHQGH